jgi:DNA-directed RNA polymerase subunit M/transcription elongation factor TFIIS
MDTVTTDMDIYTLLRAVNGMQLTMSIDDVMKNEHKYSKDEVHELVAGLLPEYVVEAFKDAVRAWYIYVCTEIIQSYKVVRDLPWEEQTILAANLEIGCYNDSVRYCNERDIESIWKNSNFKHIYEIRIRKVLTNIDANSTVNNGEIPPIIDKLLSKEIAADMLGSMSAIDINPHHSENERLFIESYTPEKIIYKESTLYKCQYCGCNRVRTSYKHTRGGDEPEDIYVFCTNCNKKIR